MTIRRFTMALALMAAIALRFLTRPEQVMRASVLCFLASAVLLIWEFVILISRLAPRIATRRTGIVWVGVLTCAMLLMLTLIFSGAYSSAAACGSNIVNPHGQPVDSFRELLYFSFISGITLSYSDFCPKGGLVRFLSCANALAFWFMLASLVYMLHRVLKLP